MHLGMIGKGVMGQFFLPNNEPMHAAELRQIAGWTDSGSGGSAAITDPEYQQYLKQHAKWDGHNRGN